MVYQPQDDIDILLLPLLFLLKQLFFYRRPSVLFLEQSQSLFLQDFVVLLFQNELLFLNHEMTQCS